MSISYRSEARGLERLIRLKILYCTEIGKQIHFLAKRCKNYQLHQKFIQIKVVEN